MSDKKIILYYTTVSSNQATKSHQHKMMTILEGKHIDYEKRDVASSEDIKQEMRDKIEKVTGNAKALPPQLFDGDTYLGNFEAFDNAVEEGEFEAFLQGKMATSTGQQQQKC